jgi:hypothetical protein
MTVAMNYKGLLKINIARLISNKQSNYLLPSLPGCVAFSRGNPLQELRVTNVRFCFFAGHSK